VICRVEAGDSMAGIRIITDITAQLKPEWIAQHGITVLPMEIQFGDEKFTISTTDDTRPLFERMAGTPAKPTRISIPTRAFQDAYTRLCRETEGILVILSSGMLNDGVSRARDAAQGFMGRCQIVVMDSQSASWGLGLIVKAAAQALERGADLDGVVRLIRGVLPHVYVVFFVERLDYLEQGGRIGVAQALLGTMLRIRPLLLIEDGDIIPMEKVRTRTMAIEKLVDFVEEFATIQDVVILRSPLENDFDEQIDELEERLSEVLPGRHFPVVGYDPLLACHLGPQALGVAVYEGM